MGRAITLVFFIVGGCTSGPIVGSWSSSTYLGPVPAGEMVTVGVSFAGDGTTRWTVSEANVAHFPAGCQRIHRTNALQWYSDSPGASGDLTVFGSLSFTVEVSGCTDASKDLAPAAEGEDPIYPIGNDVPYTVAGSDLAFSYAGDVSVHYTRQ